VSEDRTDSASLGGLSELEGRAWSGFLRTHARFVGAMSAELEARHGLSLHEYDVLRQLELAPARHMRIGDLAERVMLSRPGLTGVVARLERSGDVARRAAPDDGRGLLAEIVPTGRRRLLEAHATHLASIRRHFVEPLSDADLAALAQAWEALSSEPSRTDDSCHEAGAKRATGSRVDEPSPG